MAQKEVKTTGSSEIPGLLTGEKTVTLESQIMEMVMVFAVSLWTLQDQPQTENLIET
jgi:hypothetical protein